MPIKWLPGLLIKRMLICIAAPGTTWTGMIMCRLLILGCKKVLLQGKNYLLGKIGSRCKLRLAYWRCYGRETMGSGGSIRLSGN